MGAYNNVASLGGSINAVAQIGGGFKGNTLGGSLSLDIVNKSYNDLNDLPTINGVLVKGDLTSKDLKIERGYDAQIDPEDPEHIILRT